MSSVGAAPRPAVPISNARAEASRKNGARSRGPKTPEGKARSARNALKHGLRAQKYVVLPDEDATEFAALEAALIDELAPQGILQSPGRADRARRLAPRPGGAHRGRAVRGASHPRRQPWPRVIRDGNGTRSFETVLRYRASAMAELMRSLRMLKALQAERAATPVHAVGPAPVLAFEPKPTRATAIAPNERAGQGAAREKNPNQPEACSRPGDPAPAKPLPGPEQSWVRQASPSPSW